MWWLPTKAHQNTGEHSTQIHQFSPNAQMSWPWGWIAEAPSNFATQVTFLFFLKPQFIGYNYSQYDWLSPYSITSGKLESSESFRWSHEKLCRLNIFFTTLYLRQNIKLLQRYFLSLI